MGRQPTFRMPPPATIYGHICSAVGDFVDPAAVRFAYNFKYEDVADDLEQLYVAEVGRGRLPGSPYPKNIEATPNPVPREVLLFPELTLYLAGDELVESLAQAFVEPRFAVTLGRSQDLMTYRSVEVVDLEEAAAAYIENTLLPWAYRPRTLAGIGVMMPRYIDPDDRRRVIWSPFVLLEGRIRLTDREGLEAASHTVLARASAEEQVWVDPASATDRYGLKRAVVWHDFLGRDSGGLSFIAAPATPLG